MMQEFSNVYLDRITDSVQDETFAVIYHNCGAANPHVQTIAGLHAAAFHFGSDIDLARARGMIPADRAVMGNLDPRAFLGAQPDAISPKSCAAASAVGRACPVDSIDRMRPCTGSVDRRAARLLRLLWWLNRNGFRYKKACSGIASRNRLFTSCGRPFGGGRGFVNGIKEASG